jgi:hypothetical protein
LSARRLGVLATLAILALGVARVARADDGDPLYLSATNKLDFRRFDRESLREDAFRNRLEVSAYQGIFGAWVRLESLQLSNATVYDPFRVADPQIAGEQRIERNEVSKRAFTVDTDALDVTVGDFSHVFGNGLMLSVFEDEDLNFDTRLDGVHARFRRDEGSVTALGGSHEGNRFRGLFVEPVPWRWFRGGAGFVEAWGAEQDTEIRAREQQYGGFGEISWGPATLAGEYARREFPGKDASPSESQDGRAGFVQGIVTVGEVTVTAEYRDFFKFENEFNDPPTTLKQHAWTLLNRTNGQVLSDLPDNDAIGRLVDAEWAPGLFTTFHGSWSRLNRDQNDDDFWEAYGEAKTTWQEKAFLTAAASESEFDFGTVFEERIGGYGELVLDVNDTSSLSFGVEWEEIQDSNTVTQEYEFPHEYRERIFYLSYARSPWLNLTVTYEDSTEDDPTESRDDWTTVMAELAVAEGHDVQVSVGAERAGWKCSGGVCFYEPEFEGVKLRWIARF